jgi:hypothetical protein
MCNLRQANSDKSLSMMQVFTQFGDLTMANTKAGDTKESDRNLEKDAQAKDGYNTPLDPSQRHTGMYEKGDGKEEAQPEGGSSKTGSEGAPNQGLEKR